jgi:hypothetical protein
MGSHVGSVMHKVNLIVFWVSAEEYRESILRMEDNGHTDSHIEKQVLDSSTLRALLAQLRMSRDSAVGIATDYGLDGRGLEFETRYG